MGVSLTEGLFAPRQTNTGLYIQLHEEGYAIAEIARVQKAYRLCCAMFNGRYRKTGRPFVCHAVGAASSVAHFEKNVDFVIAGMFHAAYDSGQYPDGKSSKRTDAHRIWLEQRIGPKAEELVARLIGLTFETGILSDLPHATSRAMRKTFFFWCSRTKLTIWPMGAWLSRRNTAHRWRRGSQRAQLSPGA